MALRTFTASAVTSGPIPSPGNTAMRYKVCISLIIYILQHKRSEMQGFIEAWRRRGERGWPVVSLQLGPYFQSHANGFPLPSIPSGEQPISRFILMDGRRAYRGSITRPTHLIRGLVGRLQVGARSGFRDTVACALSRKLAVFKARTDAHLRHAVGACAHSVDREVGNCSRQAGDAVNGTEGRIARAVAGSGIVKGRTVPFQFHRRGGASFQRR